MLSTILAVSGKPGLFKFISKGKNMLLVETIDEAKKRMPVLSTDKVVALSDISIYTNDDKEVPLASVFQSAKTAYDGKAVDLSPKKAPQADIVAFFEKVLPSYDTDRVHVSDMRKVLAWYNLLVKSGIDNFDDEQGGSGATSAEAAPEAE